MAERNQGYAGFLMLRVGRIACCLALLLVLLSDVFVVKGQTTNGQISGLVTDNSGAAVPDAKVAALNTATGVPYTTRTNESGDIVLLQQTPGPYKLTVS